MMTWNHRVIRQVCDSEVLFGIHEVFYRDDGTPDLCTVDAIGVCAEGMDELTQTLEWMQKALGQPVLEMTDSEEGGKYFSDTPTLDDLLSQVTDDNIHPLI